MAIATSTAIIAGAIIAAGGATAASKISSDAAKDAAKTGAEAAELGAEAELDAIDKSIAFQKETFETQREDLAPFREIGLQALETLAPQVAPGGDLVSDFTMGDFREDPGYQFRLEEGAKALDRSAASKGRLQSGGHLRDLTKFNQDLASNEYTNAFNRYQVEQGNKFNRLSSVAGTGERTTNTLVNASTRNAESVGQNLVAAGRSRASGYTDAANAYAAGTVGSANAWAQGVQNIGNAANQGIGNYYYLTTR